MVHYKQVIFYIGADPALFILLKTGAKGIGFHHGIPKRTIDSSMDVWKEDASHLKDEMTLKSTGPISLYYESLYGI